MGGGFNFIGECECTDEALGVGFLIQMIRVWSFGFGGGGGSLSAVSSEK